MATNNQDMQFITIRITREAHDHLMKLRDIQAAEKHLTNYTITDCVSLIILNAPIYPNETKENQPL